MWMPRCDEPRDHWLYGIVAYMGSPGSNPAPVHQLYGVSNARSQTNPVSPNAQARGLQRTSVANSQQRATAHNVNRPARSVPASSYNPKPASSQRYSAQQPSAFAFARPQPSGFHTMPLASLADPRVRQRAELYASQQQKILGRYCRNQSIGFIGGGGPPPPPPPPPDRGENRRQPRGDCTPERFRELQKEVDLACRQPMRCEEIKPGEDKKEYCAKLLDNIGRFQRCINARKKIVEECFKRNPDPDHLRQIMEREKGLERCRQLQDQHCK